MELFSAGQAANKKVRGFTIIELLIVLSIIALLSAAGIAIYSGVSRNGRDTRRQSDIRSVQSALEQYNADQFFYPTAIPAVDSPFLNSSGNPNSVSTTKTYLGAIPKDPTTSTATPYVYQKSPGTCDNVAGTGTRCSAYCIYARMENAGNAVTAPTNCSYTGSFTSYNFAVTVP